MRASCAHDAHDARIMCIISDAEYLPGYGEYMHSITMNTLVYMEGVLLQHYSSCTGLPGPVQLLQYWGNDTSGKWLYHYNHLPLVSSLVDKNLC